MLFIIGLLVAAAVLVRVLGVRVPEGANTAPLGRMSEGWLAEHRAVHPS
jgi:hypothetical protein